MIRGIMVITVDITAMQIRGIMAVIILVIMEVGTIVGTIRGIMADITAIIRVTMVAGMADIMAEATTVAGIMVADIIMQANRMTEAPPVITTEVIPALATRIQIQEIAAGQVFVLRHQPHALRQHLQREVVVAFPLALLP
jgi:hypothetical protein